MASMIAYWHREGLDIYRIVNNRPVKYAAGSLDKLAPVKKIGDRKILIVGRERLLHLKKRYPPAPDETLKKAVSQEIGEIVPLSNPAFYCQVFEAYGTHVMMDIWAWESGEYAQLKEIFPFGFVVPEDILFTTATAPEMTIYQYHGIVHALAYGSGKFFGGKSFPSGTINQTEVDRFIEGLSEYRVGINKIKIFGRMPISAEDRQSPEIVKVPEPLYPPCLDYFVLLELSRFKIKRDYGLLQKKDFILRICLYLVLGYALMLYLTLRNYDAALYAVRQKVIAIDRQIAAMSVEHEGTAGNQTGIAKELNEKLTARRSALSTMDTLARRLPPGSFVNRMVLNENNTDVSISSKEPLTVLRMLGDAPEVQKVSFKGPPVKDRSTTLYNFNITIEFVR